MLFNSAIKTLILIGLFIAIPIALLNLSCRCLNRLYGYCRLRLLRQRPEEPR